MRLAAAFLLRFFFFAFRTLSAIMYFLCIHSYSLDTYLFASKFEQIFIYFFASFFFFDAVFFSFTFALVTIARGYFIYSWYGSCLFRFVQIHCTLYLGYALLLLLLFYLLSSVCCCFVLVSARFCFFELFNIIHGHELSWAWAHSVNLIVDG